MSPRRTRAFSTGAQRAAAARATVTTWIADNRDTVWDALRIYLGFALVIKGFVYMTHHGELAARMEQADVAFAGPALAEVVAVAHITGGLMMTFGLLTRIGAAIQIPNLLGALFFVHLREGFFTEAQTLEFTLLVLALLCVITVVGAGRLSIDWAFTERRPPFRDAAPASR
jgi:putative oxidoreductase